MDLHAERPIGIFDSGVGGLSVVKALLEQMPAESFVYFGDTANVPYGNKSVPELFSLSRRIIAYFIRREVKAIIVACGTQSSNTLPVLEKECPVPIVGMLKPGIETALEVSDKKYIAVLATQATVSSRAYTKEIKNRCPDGRVLETACPAFVPLVENGQLEGEKTIMEVKKVAERIKKEPFDTLILGCTHYPFLINLIKKELDCGLHFVDPASATVAATMKILRNLNLLRTNDPSAVDHEFLVSGPPESFMKVGQLLLGTVVDEVQKIAL
ncbi:MAG: glutamate racemase [Syntrophomonadaceae bacterium]|nr:glutamate racemase [Syntrophomonadaceae bacterium]